MRTDQEALLHAYLSEYEKIQANTVSGGKKKVASSAATGAQNMDRMGRVSIPKSYDPVPALVNMAVQQNKSELAEAERQRKAAERAAAKAAKEAAQQEEKDAAAKAATERWAQLQQKAGGNTKAEPSGKKKSKFKEDEGNKTAATQANRRGKNTGNWLEVLGQSMIEAAPQTLNAALPGGNIASMMGMRPEAPSVEIPQRSLAEQMALYTQQAAKAQELQAALAQLARDRMTMDGEQAESPASLNGFALIPSLDQYLQAGNLLDISQRTGQKKQELDNQEQALRQALKTAEQQAKQYDAELHAMVAELAPETQYNVWVSPNYKLSSQEQARANEFFKEAVEQNPGILWEEYAQQYPASAQLLLKGVVQGQPKYMGYDGAAIVAAYNRMSDEEKAQAQKINFVRKKISNPAAFANSAMDAMPFYTDFAENAQQANAEAKGFERLPELDAEQLLSQQRQQSPIMGTSGALAGTMMEYGAGSQLMKAIPGVGKALGKAGEAVAGTRAAQALQQVPVLGHLGTADAVAGILGDQILDTAFDTIPSLYDDIHTYNTQGPDGTLTVGDIVGNTVGSVGLNLGMNLLGEGVQGALQNHAARKALEERNALEMNHVLDLDDVQWPPSLEMPKEAVATPAGAALGYTAELPMPNGADGFKAVLDGAGGTSEIRALTEAFENGTLTRAQMETLKPGGANRAAFEEATGLRLPPTSSETRRMLTAGAGGLDNAGRSGYSEIAGGAKNGTDLGAGAGGVKPLREGAGNFDVQGARRDAAGNQRVFRQPVTDPDGYARAGATVQVLEDTTQYPEAFCSALDEAIEKNKHGLMVSPKTPQELADSGAITFMSRDGMCGAAVTADGDIEAVFRIPGGEGKRLSYQMVVTAIDNGGVKLDCYGSDLAYNYSRMGFEPVARVRWNPDYAPEGWTYGPKDVYVMKLGDGLDADQVLRRMGLSEADGGFHIYTEAELKALPEMDYDAALAYRDGLLSGRNGGGRPLGELDIQTASWDEILNSPEIRQAREQAKFDTPTIEINTPERQALRQQIADDLMQMGSFSGKDAAGNELFAGPVRRERRADIVIGPPAAGKSSVLANPLSQQYGSRIIDSDMAKAKLPEFNGGLGAGQVHLESAQIAEGIMIRQAIRDGDNIVIPWVGKTPEKLRTALEKLKRAGYTVYLSLNELDPDKAARRAVERFQNTGRLVDPEYVLSVGWKPSEVYDILKTEGRFDGYVRYSNDVPYGQPAKLIEGPGMVEEVQAGRMGGLGGRFGAGSDGPGTGRSSSAGENSAPGIGDSYARYANDVEFGQPARLAERGGKAESGQVQDGRVGGYGRELWLDSADGVENRRATSAGAAEVGSQGNPAAISMPDGLKERGYAESLRTKSDLPDEVKQAFIDEPDVYRQLSNAETAARADQIMSQGLDRATVQYRELLAKKDPAAVPLGKDIADELIAQGRREEAVQVLREMSEKLTQSGQFSQAAAITLMKNDPMTALQYVQKDIDKMNREGAKKFGRKWKDFVLTEGEVAAFGAAPAGDEAALKGLFEQVGARIAREYPVTTWEKLVEASHVAMLLNPRTQTRNAFANSLILPEQWFSRKLSAAGQNVLSWFKKDYQPNQALRVSRESKDLAAQAYDTIKARIGETASGKWENTVLKGWADKEVFKPHGEQNFVSRIPMLGDTFDWMGRSLGRASEKLTGENVFKALSDEKSVAENLRQFTYGLLELGDAPFVKRNFVNRMASFIEARGYKSLQEVPPEAYEVAWQEALKATFKDDNAISNAIVSLKRTTGPFGEMAMPFTKTPANITARALDYSPYGLARGAVRWVRKGGDPSAYIDEISKGLTGTGLILLGVQLYKSGVVTGPASGNKRQAAFDKQQGKLPYSIKIGDNYYTCDWAQPAATGLVLGSTIAAQIERDGGIDAQSIAEIIKNSGVTFIDTLLEQSTLQSVADLFGGYSSFGENFFNEAIETPQRLLPSLMGAAARTMDPVQRQTFSSGDALKTQLDTFQSKIPFLSQNLPAAYDTWGNEIRRADSVGESALAQFLSPGQLGNAATTPLDGEITRLYEATGDESVFPRKADWSVTFNGVTHKLDNMSYSEFQQVMGQLSFQLADELMESPAYRSMSDEAKAATLSDAYDLAKKVGQAQVLPEYDPDDKLYGIYQRGGADAVIPYLLSHAEIQAARQSKREVTGNENANLNYAELYDSVYGVPGLGADEYAQAYLAHAVNDKAGRLAYHEQGADGLETYLQVRTVADVDDNGSISKAELVATLDAAELTEAQKAYYFGIILPKAKNPYQ